MNEDMQIAATIVNQLGGKRRLCAMTGAYNFLAGNKTLTFRFKNQGRRINCVRISLNGKDLYDVEFCNIRKYECKTVETFNDVYADSLVELFENTTGLYLRF